MTPLLAFLQAHPEVVALGAYLLALGAHVGVGVALHATRLADFSWDKIGQFMESDLWSKRAGVMLVTFIGTVVTTTSPNADIRSAFGPAFATLVVSATASTLPLVRDTLTELGQLIGGVPAPARAPAKAAP